MVVHGVLLVWPWSACLALQVFGAFALGPHGEPREFGLCFCFSTSPGIYALPSVNQT